ncbi:TIGR02587 family membrane protein [Propylenella binzhouense]|uniref:TIGR02587 family membrane protein n=1 Tax=Propylenella binzhouense TaxID=2555902 RepID=A0A964WUD6_9HYPH|nr:TIGR02587 family membrane protein [Propylenella binzhouense]MYZ48951.1 TIGR02587 family membrane protein [Propylenella binzhouense]
MTVRSEASGRDRDFLVGLARAFAGAVIFALPMLMTMEMWFIGFYVEPLRLLLLLVLLVPLLTGLAYFSGFKQTSGLLEEVVDSFVAVAVAAIMSVVVLALFRIVTPDMPAREIVGKLALQIFAGSIGAMLAQDQMGGQSDMKDEQRKRRASYPAVLLMMAAGALFLGLNVAPTEEMVLLSYKMDPWRELALALLSIVSMHAFVFAVEFPGAPEVRPGTAFWSLFFRYTVVGYALVLAISWYLLWTFGRTDGTGYEEIASATIVLGFPCAIGAAAARLVL